MLSRIWQIELRLSIMHLFQTLLFTSIVQGLSAVKYVFKHYPTGRYEWNGCLFKAADWLLPSNHSKCGQCIESGTKLAKNTEKYFMTFRNCTSHCQHPSICTSYKFNIRGTWRPECFACDVEVGDHVTYKAIPISELCGHHCAKCALTADLHNATNCYKTCRGKPTFCPSNEPLFYGQKICYQAMKLHGCHWKAQSSSQMFRHYGHSCVECASHVDKKDADLCAHLCGNMPAWHTHLHAEKPANETTHDDHESENKLQLFRCILPELGDVLEYEIPDKIRSLINYGSTLYTNTFLHLGGRRYINGSEILEEEDDEIGDDDEGAMEETNMIKSRKDHTSVFGGENTSGQEKDSIGDAGTAEID